MGHGYTPRAPLSESSPAKKMPADIRKRFEKEYDWNRIQNNRQGRYVDAEGRPNEPPFVLRG